MLTHDEDGNIRFSEKLTEKDAYIENYPDNCKSFWKDIAMELQLFGGNTFANNKESYPKWMAFSTLC